jgi:YidC/Oxa1 family membrane protein insertase
MEKRMVVAIALSLMVLLAFQFMSPKKTTVSPVAETSYEKTIVSPVRGDVELAARPATQKASRKEETTEIQTDKYELVFSDIGASLKKVTLKDYLEESAMEVLYEQEDPAKRTFALTSSLLAGLDSAKFMAKQGMNTLEYTYVEPEWIQVTKRYVFDKSLYYIHLEIIIKNISPRKMDLSYDIVGPSSISAAGKVSGRNFLEANTMIDGKIWKVGKAKGIQERKGIIGWTALKNRYFAMIMKPLTSANAVIVKDAGAQQPITEINVSRISLGPNEETRQEYAFYAGPLVDKTIALVDEDMQGVIDFGFFGAVSKVLLTVLRFWHSVTHSWGVSIILLTVLINIILFPLTVKSFSSMHQMKKIQPHIQKLKDLHKDNPQKLNKETMELYKRYNVNPLGGCLPLILQMPIFIALYQGLMRSIELKGATFLWIKDLAKPDAVPIPFTLPLIGNSVNILPLLMVVMMVVQQKITQAGSANEMTAEQASQQKMMMMAMPLLFGFMFYNMPAGLVLYWLTNTILMTIEQGMISRRMADQK